MSKKQKTSRTLALFDVDGTLTVPRQVSRDDVPQMHSGVPDTTTLFNDTVRFWQAADDTDALAAVAAAAAAAAAAAGSLGSSSSNNISGTRKSCRGVPVCYVSVLCQCVKHSQVRKLKPRMSTS